MTREARTITALTLVGLLAAALPAVALQKTFVLKPVSKVKAAGIGQLIAQGKKEAFRVRVFADLPEGSGLLVLIQRAASIGTADDLIPIGKIQIVLGSGLLELNRRDHVSPVFPVGGVTRVVIRSNETDILTAKIPSLSTSR